MKGIHRLSEAVNMSDKPALNNQNDIQNIISY